MTEKNKRKKERRWQIRIKGRKKIATKKERKWQIRMKGRKNEDSNKERKKERIKERR